MKNLCMPLIAVGVIFAVGCRSTNPSPVLFGGTVADTRAYLDNYNHILLVCVTGDHVTRRELPSKSERHFTGTVVRVYKGDWAITERVSWVKLLELDEGESAESNKYKGDLYFVFTNTHTDREMFLDVGDGPRWSEWLAKQIYDSLK